MYAWEAGTASGPSSGSSYPLGLNTSSASPATTSRTAAPCTPADCTVDDAAARLCPSARWAIKVRGRRLHPSTQLVR